jgi:acyl carrier protein
VKIKGFRIELEEIEKQLAKVPGIKEAVVIDRQDRAGDSYLCAYIVSDRDTAVSGLRDILSRTLPGYMLPQYFVRLNRVPVTSNGKVDRKALPEPEIKSEKVYTAPRNGMDEQLVRIWSEMLGLEKACTGIDDNFFELGGNSLKATVLITKIHKTFNTRITLTDIFERPTVRGLVEHIKGMVKDKYVSIEPVEKKEYYPFSSAQQRLYIQQQSIPGNISYNMPAFFILEGRLNRERLETVFQQLVFRHESFRTSFEIAAEEPMQRIHDQVEFEIERPAAVETFVRPFDLSCVPLLRVGLIEISTNRHILMVDMHHIITDGMSMEIMRREFVKLYIGETLPPLALQYKDFSQWQNRLFVSGEIKKQERYWLKQFEGDIPVLNLPTDFPRSETRSYEGRGISFEINREITAAVNQMVLETGTTLHVLLLAIFNILLAKYGGQEDIVVGTGIAGRQHADLENVIGLFINMLALRNQPAQNKTFIQFLGEVKGNALDAYDNQDYQFEELVRKLDLQGNPAGNPLFDVVFQTQDMDIPGIEIQGLTLKPYDKEFSASRFDLVIYIREEGDWLSMRLVYSPALFKKSTLQHMAEHFVEIAEQVLKNRDVRIKDIKITTHFSAAVSRMPKHDTQFQF